MADDTYNALIESVQEREDRLFMKILDRAAGMGSIAAARFLADRGCRADALLVLEGAVECMAFLPEGVRAGGEWHGCAVQAAIATRPPRESISAVIEMVTRYRVVWSGVVLPKEIGDSFPMVSALPPDVLEAARAGVEVERVLDWGMKRGWRVRR